MIITFLVSGWPGFSLKIGVLSGLAAARLWLPVLSGQETPSWLLPPNVLIDAGARSATAVWAGRMEDGKWKMEKESGAASSGDWPGYKDSSLHASSQGLCVPLVDEHLISCALVANPFLASFLTVAAANPDAQNGNDGSDPLSIGKWLICLGALLWIYNQAREAFAAKVPAQVEQPIRTTAEHPCVEKPDFESHKEEIWEVVNGLRRSISRIEADISAIKALREANGERLAEMARDMKQLSDQISKLAGIMEGRGE